MNQGSNYFLLEQSLTKVQTSLFLRGYKLLNHVVISDAGVG